MILEGIVTTLGANGEPHVAAMGATVSAAMQQFALRPFQSSATFDNLQRERRGVLHITDDVEIIACAALGQWPGVAATIVSSDCTIPRLADCCRWYAFQVTEIDDREDRAILTCQVRQRGRQREFVGFNRAKHAVLELTIMATRIHLLPASEILQELERSRRIVDKTAGPAEARAFEAVAKYIGENLKKL